MELSIYVLHHDYLNDLNCTEVIWGALSGIEAVGLPYLAKSEERRVIVCSVVVFGARKTAAHLLWASTTRRSILSATGPKWCIWTLFHGAVGHSQ